MFCCYATTPSCAPLSKKHLYTKTISLIHWKEIFIPCNIQTVQKKCVGMLIKSGWCGVVCECVCVCVWERERVVWCDCARARACMCGVVWCGVCVCVCTRVFPPHFKMHQISLNAYSHYVLGIFDAQNDRKVSLISVTWFFFYNVPEA
jgi:hypothetical protein